MFVLRPKLETCLLKFKTLSLDPWIFNTLQPRTNSSASSSNIMQCAFQVNAYKYLMSHPLSDIQLWSIEFQTWKLYQGRLSYLFRLSLQADNASELVKAALLAARNHVKMGSEIFFLFWRGKQNRKTVPNDECVLFERNQR